MGKRLAKKNGPLEIILPSGQKCFIDADDAWIQEEFPFWRVNKDKTGRIGAVVITRYIQTGYGRVREDRYLHRVVMHKFPKKYAATQVDHRDRNPLNNTKDNLRWVSAMENSRNSTHRGKNKTSKYRGVFLSSGSRRRPWIAQIKMRGRGNHIGSYATEREAALAYNKKSKELYGEYGWQNDVK